MRTNPYLLLLAAVIVLSLGALWWADRPRRNDMQADAKGELFVYCAAGLRKPAEAIAEAYLAETGVRVLLQYGGSNTLLSQAEISQTGDLFLSADDSYLELGQQRRLVDEALPLAAVRAVVAVPHGNPKSIHSISDLLRDDVRLALANPDQAAIGKVTRDVLEKTGHWEAINQRVRDRGVFKPTVGDVANDVMLGSVDAGIVWDAVAHQYPDLEIVRLDELSSGQGNIAVGVLRSSKAPTEAQQFARYLAASDRGLLVFDQMGYPAIDGAVWDPTDEEGSDGP